MPGTNNGHLYVCGGQPIFCPLSMDICLSLVPGTICYERGFCDVEMVVKSFAFFVYGFDLEVVGYAGGCGGGVAECGVGWRD
ncbi:hypothetical protein ACFFLP_19825 [Bacillus benzoevorans]